MRERFRAFISGIGDNSVTLCFKGSVKGSLVNVNRYFDHRDLCPVGKTVARRPGRGIGTKISRCARNDTLRVPYTLRAPNMPYARISH